MIFKSAAHLVILVGASMIAHGADPADVDPNLAFEGCQAGALPPGWVGITPETDFCDDKVFHGGASAGRIDRTAQSKATLSGFSATLPMSFEGKAIELRGFLKTENVEGGAGLWMREDDGTQTVARDAMEDRPVRGTTDWTEYTIRLPVSAAGRTLFFGALLWGTGKVWVDDLQLLVDGKPIKDAPKVEHPKTALDTDTEFDAGSKVTISALTPAQTANLVTLGKVWGFLKYHHPKVVAGAVHWDYELFRVMPRVLAAASRKGAQQAILTWAKSLGDVAKCDPCASLDEGLAITPDIGWIHDRATLGTPLSEYLENVHRNRPPGAEQAYVAMAPFVGNPIFRREKNYPEPVLPDAGMRILALYRWWNVIQYWSPYRNVIGSDWNAVLPEFLPRIVAATDIDRYRAEMLALISRLNDGHANIWGALQSRPPLGGCQIPIRLRFVEGKAVVVGYTHATWGPASGLKVGDAILTLDGVPIERFMESWKPYYSASNDAARMAAIMTELTDGMCDAVKVGAERAGAPLAIATERRAKGELDLQGGRTHDLPGSAFRRLSPDVAYLKLSAVKIEDIADYLRAAADSKGWIVDIRNYPSQFVVFALGGHFVDEETPFARFTAGDTANPGAFHWSDPALAIHPLAPAYVRKIVILVDETSMSQAEYTALAFRASPSAIVVGSTTAGADGNVSTVPLPGGLESWISGIGVFYPDRRPTQRVGIVPDVEAHPTIAGIREGRDEVLEAAIRQIVGPDVPEVKVREIARP